MSRWSEQEDKPKVASWTPGAHKRPSIAKPPDFWEESPRGTWRKQGWTVQEAEVANCLPKGGQPGIMYRVFEPGAAKHCGSFTLCWRAKAWAEERAKQHRGQV